MFLFVPYFMCTLFVIINIFLPYHRCAKHFTGQPQSERSTNFTIIPLTHFRRQKWSVIITLQVDTIDP